MKVTMVYNTTAKDLIVENGKVVGANCEASDGSKIPAKGNCVVLATGGFARNVELREKYNAEINKWPTLDDSILSTNCSPTTATASSWRKPWAPPSPRCTTFSCCPWAIRPPARSPATSNTMLKPVSSSTRKATALSTRAAAATI
jgi:hypothetical protein